MADSNTLIQTPISPGELLDKISILEIKLDRIDDAKKRAHVKYEYDLLSSISADQIERSETLDSLYASLKHINETLWDIEDDIRDCERNKDFSKQFIDLARSVYITNDKRASIKKDINLLLGSHIVEHKSYTAY